MISTVRRTECDLEIGVVYSGERTLAGPLLDSLSRSGDGLALRLILVDNASADCARGLTNGWPDIVRLRNEKPLGYAANLNRILAASRAPYVLLLNIDMLFDPREQCLRKLVAFMEAEPDCGMAGCRLYNARGDYGFPARRFPTPASILARRVPGLKLFPGALARHLYQEYQPHTTFACDWLSGCLMMIRRAAYQSVGEFDQRYGKYFEDVDYAQRMAQAGWSVMFHGETFAWHWEQRASRKIASRDVWRHLRAYWRWLRKWRGERKVRSEK